MIPLDALVSPVWQHLRRLNWVLLGLVLVLLAISVTYIQGIAAQSDGAMAHYGVKQLVWAVAGLVMAVGIAAVDFHRFGRGWWIVYVAALALLVAVLVVGERTNGQKCWINFGFFTLQPAELAKPALIIALAWRATHASRRLGELGEVMHVVLLSLPPMALIALQPDFGSALLFVPITIGILYIAGIRKRFLGYPFLAAVLMAPAIYSVLPAHQKKRIEVFLNPITHPVGMYFGQRLAQEKGLPEQLVRRMPEMRDPYAFIRTEIDLMERKITQDEYHKIQRGRPSLKDFELKEGWQAKQSLLCVGSGGLTGKGIGQSTQVQLGFMPRAISPSDCLFSVIAEEGGFVMCCLILLLLGGIFYCCIWIAMSTNDRFGKGLALGIGILFMCHAFINVGMAINISPIIGIPLPFLSYGGSFIISSLLCIGVLQSVWIHRHGVEDEARPDELA